MDSLSFGVIRCICFLCKIRKQSFLLFDVGVKVRVTGFRFSWVPVGYFEYFYSIAVACFH